MAKIKLGTNVKIKRKKSVKHFAVNNMTILGRVVVVDLSHYEGRSWRPYLVLFQDGRTSWWHKRELSAKKDADV
ncbi:hypothetical protein KAR91_77670 [Candidatus Pacearchaeota archaeon]|nr:hypothetical protein [Candidatus Pacearchaeota archaeon]